MESWNQPMEGEEGAGVKERFCRGKALEKGPEGNATEQLTAAAVTTTLFGRRDSTTPAVLKSGTLSVEKVSGHISTSTVMSACDRYLRIGNLKPISLLNRL